MHNHRSMRKDESDQIDLGLFQVAIDIKTNVSTGNGLEKLTNYESETKLEDQREPRRCKKQWRD